MLDGLALQHPFGARGDMPRCQNAISGKPFAHIFYAFPLPGK
jgi:hypothetical protein